MKRIGITQRVSTRFHGVAHDCLDQAWSDLLSRAGFVPVSLPNLGGDGRAIEAYLSELGISGLILSGGNDIAGQGEVAGSEVSLRRDAFERAAIEWARDRDIAVLGVCRGLQMINVALGGGLRPIEGHAGVRHEVERIDVGGADIFSELPRRFEVNSFHNFAVSVPLLAPELVPVLVDGEGNVEAFCHQRETIAAIMWHPERVSPFAEDDLQLLRRVFVDA